MPDIIANAIRAIAGLLLLTVLTLNSLQAQALYQHADVDALLSADEAPAGVVFEILSGQQNAWQWAAPMLKQFQQQLKHKFAQIDIVVVSHGNEQFQLTRENAVNNPQAIDTLQSLSAQGTNIHVCGVHSGWRDVSEDSYLDFVDVSASGPAQINDYVNLGYKRIILRRPKRR